MTYALIPIDKLTWYHLPSLLAAEAGRLRYDRSRYPIHAVSNNAMACHWGGLLEDGHGGMRLSVEGRARLAEWKASPEGCAWLASEASDDEGDQQEPAVRSHRQTPTESGPAPTVEVASQLTLFPEDAQA
ncbi:hypothetical protein [Streptomyces virginiae]|uniref:hypothetical protein n=1 Tax=Streptomyces virginiae TaxID=1961 RepID=UPI0022538DFA|nr:hypothetical protein [Streptomyces virginiae]MCX5278026.1 hypothetical protein [Streptomyces virginiae]